MNATLRGLPGLHWYGTRIVKALTCEDGEADTVCSSELSIVSASRRGLPFEVVEEGCEYFIQTIASFALIHPIEI